MKYSDELRKGVDYIANETLFIRSEAAVTLTFNIKQLNSRGSIYISLGQSFDNTYK
jgi:hypothetical protein